MQNDEAIYSKRLPRSFQSLAMTILIENISPEDSLYSLRLVVISLTPQLIYDSDIVPD